VKKVVISEFKAKCIALLRDAQRTGESILVTRRGQPIARVEPVREVHSERPLGIFRGRMKVRGDIVHADTSADWEALE
jgi:prevent-host-death family protein